MTDIGIVCCETLNRYLLLLDLIAIITGGFIVYLRDTYYIYLYTLYRYRFTRGNKFFTVVNWVVATAAEFETNCTEKLSKRYF